MRKGNGAPVSHSTGKSKGIPYSSPFALASSRSATKCASREVFYASALIGQNPSSPSCRFEVLCRRHQIVARVPVLKSPRRPTCCSAASFLKEGFGKSHTKGAARIQGTASSTSTIPVLILPLGRKLRSSR